MTESTVPAQSFAFTQLPKLPSYSPLLLVVLGCTGLLLIPSFNSPYLVSFRLGQSVRYLQTILQVGLAPYAWV